jgi:hypothetical protein
MLIIAILFRSRTDYCGCDLVEEILKTKNMNILYNKTEKITQEFSYKINSGVVKYVKWYNQNKTP